MATKTIGAKAAGAKKRAAKGSPGNGGAKKKASTDIPLDNIPERETRKIYPVEVKLDAVKRYNAGESSSAIARDIGASDTLVTKWAKTVADGKPLLGMGGARNRGKVEAAEPPNLAAALRNALDRATAHRNERLEAAAAIVELDGPGGKESSDLAKRIRAMKRENLKAS